LEGVEKMGFINNPLGFSSYGMQPGYLQQPMADPAVTPFATFEPTVSPFGSFDPSMSSFGMSDPSMLGLGGMQPNHFMPGAYPMPYPRPFPPSPYGPQMSSPYGGGDPSGGMMGMIGYLFQMFTSLLGGGNNPSNNPVDTKVPPDTDIPAGDKKEAPKAKEEDSRLKKIERLEPEESNADVLEVLSIYSKDLGAKGGMLTKDALEDFIDYGAKEKGVPDKVIKAAEALRDNETLFNLLCTESDSTADEGFSLSALKTDWEDDLDIESLHSVSSPEKAVDILNEHKDALAAISSSTAGNGTAEGTSKWISEDDLRKVALGEEDLGLNDRDAAKLQAAALKILNDEDTLEELDTIDPTSGTYIKDAKYKDGVFDIGALSKWLEKND
jgi:hypothetical protein